MLPGGVVVDGLGVEENPKKAVPVIGPPVAGESLRVLVVEDPYCLPLHLSRLNYGDTVSAVVDDKEGGEPA